MRETRTNLDSIESHCPVSALAAELVPYECAFLCAENTPSADTQALCAFLSGLAAEEGVEVAPQELVDSLERADALGVPLIGEVEVKWANISSLSC